MKSHGSFGFVVAFLLSVVLQPASGFGGIPYSPIPITTAIGRAEVIVVASVSEYIAGPKPILPPVITQSKDLAAMMAFQDAGIYRFHVEQTIKGKCQDDLAMTLEFLTPLCFGNNTFVLPNGAKVLLLLKRDDSNHWAPVDFKRPLIPLSNDPKRAASSTQPAKDGHAIDHIDVLLASCDDPKLQPIIMNVLHDVKDNRVEEKAKTLADDTNLELRSDALNAMAINQDLSAIPKIAALEKSGVAHGPIGAFRYYTTEDAVPYLNPLILDGPDYLRLNAMAALRPIADNSSFPFLIYAVNHDDRQHSVSYDAYATLHRLEPILGGSGTVTYFENTRDQQIALLNQWWEHEKILEKTPEDPATQPAN